MDLESGSVRQADVLGIEFAVDLELVGPLGEQRFQNGMLPGIVLAVGLGLGVLELLDRFTEGVLFGREVH